MVSVLPSFGIILQCHSIIIVIVFFFSEYKKVPLDPSLAKNRCNVLYAKSTHTAQ